MHHKDILIEQAARLVRDADAIIVAAGAGMGGDSGLPDFRGNSGFWQAYPALAAAGMDFQAAASADSFVHDPVRAWGFYGHRLALYRRTVPHAGFALLRKWASAKAHGGSVFTSNVDGQFQRAGVDRDHVHECHGSIHHLQCTTPCSDEVWSAGGFSPVVDEQTCALVGALPVCPRCGAVARPNILMFADWTWVDAVSEAQRARQQRWLEHARNPLVIEIGAGTAVPTVRHFSERMWRRHGASLVRINMREAGVEGGHGVGLALAALDALRAIDRVL
ncbi:SIR2 family NAD-dependent protein deacylase [Massilia sp. DWR3-1-1]|uniref:SIR2 family NAD-dependent protein deacylase n=1 Tax=Massilia sp. DWR3-1-1 TaxID=2804559 RepID=UPI003CE9BCEB